MLAFPALLLVGTGLIAHNALAVLYGLFGGQGAFHRTPKFASDWDASAYALRTRAALLDLAFAGYALWGCWLAWIHSSPLLPYLILHVLAFALVAVWDLRDQQRIARYNAPRLLAGSGSD